MDRPGGLSQMVRARVTIRDVAARAGVSRQTISRVINGSKMVNPETSARVQAVIAELGYQPHAIARSMARGRTQTLACIAPNLLDYTFASVINGAEAAVRAQGYFLMSTSAPDVETFASLVADLTGGGYVDGLLVINPFADERHRYLPTNTPTVLIGARPRAEAADSVALDDVAAGRMATEHLLALGHRTIAMVTGPHVEDCTQDRQAGYCMALEAAGLPLLPELIVEGDWTPQSGYDGLWTLFSRQQSFTALFAQNDLMAIGALRAAHDCGRKVPNELSVIGVDDIPLAAHVEPPLTTLRQDFAALGCEAVRLLFDVIADPSKQAEHVRQRPEMVIRASVGRLS